MADREVKMTKADIALSDIKEILKSKYHPVTTIVNCVSHMNRSILERPDSCTLCQTDIKNTLSQYISVNEWLNLWKEDMQEAWDRFAVELLTEIGVING